MQLSVAFVSMFAIGETKYCHSKLIWWHRKRGASEMGMKNKIEWISKENTLHIILKFSEHKTVSVEESIFERTGFESKHILHTYLVISLIRWNF